MWPTGLQGRINRILVRHSPDGGVTWDPTVRIADTVFYPVVARGAGGLVVLTSSPDPAVRVRISRNGGASFGQAVRIGAYKPGPGCAYDPGRTGIAISGRVVLVVHWKSPRGSSSTGAPTGAGPGSLRSPCARASRARTPSAWRSTDPACWSPSSPGLTSSRASRRIGARRGPRPEPSVRGLRFALARAGGTWRIAYQRGNALRYRSSANGLTWSAEETVATIPAADDATPLGVGVVGGGAVVPWVHYRSAADDETLEWGARS